MLKARGAAGTFQSFAHTGVVVLRTTFNNKIRLEVEWLREALTPQKTLVVAIKKFLPLTSICLVVSSGRGRRN